MPETYDAFVQVCFPRDEVPILDFAAQERGQTRSKFLYTLARNELRRLGLLPMPAIPKLPNGKELGEHHG